MDIFPHPSCLIFGYTKENKVLHIVAGSNDNSLFFITAYYPNTDKFETDLKMFPVKNVNNAARNIIPMKLQNNLKTL